MIHPLETMIINTVQNFMAIHPVVVVVTEIFQSGPQLWINQHSLVPASQNLMICFSIFSFYMIRHILNFLEGWTNRANRRCRFGLWETVMGIFFPTIFWQKIISCMSWLSFHFSPFFTHTCSLHKALMTRLIANSNDTIATHKRPLLHPHPPLCVHMTGGTVAPKGWRGAR